ncbi:MAG TPA: radical SAM protein, partial [bacterium]|nr:radical SAM protein [bacterium]
ITKMIKENNFHKKAVFHGSARADSVDEDIVRACKEVNFVFLGVGVETHSDRLLKVLKKNETAAQIRTAVELIAKYDIMTTTGLIFGIPEQTRKDRYDTIKYALDLPIDNTRFNTIVPYPGTELYDIAVKEGRLNKKENYYNFNVQYYLFGNDIPYVPKGADKFELIFDTMWANIRFYLSIKKLKRFRKSPYAGGVTIHIPKKISISNYIVFLKFSVLVLKRFVEIGVIVCIRTILKKIKLLKEEM